jgi:hypothetical protein
MRNRDATTFAVISIVEPAGMNRGDLRLMPLRLSSIRSCANAAKLLGSRCILVRIPDKRPEQPGQPDAHRLDARTHTSGASR